MKIAISGKGGVGKTTIVGGLARLMAVNGQRVLAIDADPDANLASAIGITAEEVQKVTPLAEMSDLIAERTGAQPGTIGGFFKLNPKVDDLPEKLSLEAYGVRLMILGHIDKGGSGCICPESALLKALISHLVLQRDESLVMDMEAGIEHLGRATAQSVDALLVVVEPGMRSVQTAKAIDRLARDIGIEKTLLVLNKVQGAAEEKSLIDALPELTYLGSIGYSELIRKADLEDVSPFDLDKDFVRQLQGLMDNLVQQIDARQGKRQAQSL